MRIATIGSAAANHASNRPPGSGVVGLMRSSLTPAGSVASATKPGVAPVYVPTTKSAVAARPITAASATDACHT